MILTTLSGTHIPNAAPIGIINKGGKLFARIYNSTTLSNILENPVAAANIVDDPVLFVKSALSDIEPLMFELTEDFPVIRHGLGWVIFDCNCRKGENISLVELIPIRGKIVQKIIKPVNRGFNAIIEAAIHATRYVNLKEKKYLREIDKCDKIVTKCGGAKDKEAMKLLYELIGYPSRDSNV